MSKKPRKAKKHPFSLMSSIWYSNLPNVWFIGGHCFDTTIYEGLKGKNEIARANELAWIMRTPLKWSVLVMAFNDNDRQCWVDHRVWNSPVACTAMEMKLQAEDVIEQNVKSCNEKFVIGSGYVAVPSQLVDMEASLDNIIDYFKKAGAFDQDWCNTVWALKEKKQ